MESSDITRQPLRAKLLVVFAIIFAMTAGIGWLGVAGMNRSWNRMGGIFDTTFRVNLHIARANVSLIQWNRSILHRILSVDPAEAATQEASIELHERETFEHLRDIAENAATPSVKEGAARMAEAFRRILPLKERALLAVGESRRGDAYDFMVDELRPRVDELIGMVEELVEIKQQDVAALALDIDAQMRRDTAMIVALLLAAVAVYGVVAYGMSRSILRAVGELVRGSRSVSEGDLAGARVDLPAGDEFGYVGQAFNGMLASVERSLAEEKAAAAELARHRDRLEEVVAERTKELGSQWSRLLDIMHSFPEMVYVIDPDTHEILFANRKMEEALGEVVGTKCYQTLMGCMRPCSSCLDIRLLKGVETRTWETRLPTTGRDMIITDQRVRWIDGREVRLELAVDITERKKAEARLRAVLEDLERSNRELEQFAYIASHDLQEPLRMVSSYTQLLARRYKGRLDADADDFIGFAVDGAERMQRLINDLLTYSRVGTRGLELAPVEALEVLDEAKANLKAAIAESNATVTAGDLPTVTFDRTQLVQVFQNLIGNAIKFAREDEPPRVLVSAERKDEGWVFSVLDNGIGIAPEYRERIFAIFQRLHGRRRYPGTGIGLALCRRIVERRGGLIWVDSAEGEGSTFRFTVPDSAAGPKGTEER